MEGEDSMKKSICFTVLLLLVLFHGSSPAATSAEVSQQLKNFLQLQSADLKEKENSLMQMQKSFLDMMSSAENSGMSASIDKLVQTLQTSPLSAKLKEIQAANKKILTAAPTLKNDINSKVSASQSSMKQVQTSIDKLNILADQMKLPAASADISAKLQTEMNNLASAQDSFDKSATESQSIFSLHQVSFTALQKAQDSLKADGNFGSTPGLSGGDMVQKMAKMNMEYLALQEAYQMESRRFQTLSNASKARHAAALASIKGMK